jgi:hypothetical protein
MSLSDPADKAQGQDQFKPVVNRRAGYSTDGFQRIMACARKGGSLSAGEGLQIIQHFEDLLFQYKTTARCREGCELMKVTPEHCFCWQDVRNCSPA